MPRPGCSILICFIWAATATMPVAADFSGRNGFFAAFGGDYQYISQEFYRAVLDTTTLDLIETWQLDADKIDDFIFKTNIGYNFQNRLSNINILGDLELSGDRFLGRTEGSYQFGDYDNRLKLLGKFETKASTYETDKRVEEYDYFQACLSGRKRISRPVSVNFKTAYEWVSFGGKPGATTDGNDSLFMTYAFYGYDYSMISGWAGGDIRLTEYTSELTWRAGYNRREVPDSGEACYDQYRFGLEYNYSSLKGVLSLGGEIEIRDYMQPLGADDFKALIWRGRASRSLGDRIELGGNFQSDWYRYRRPDFVNRDYRYIRGEINETTRINGWGWGPLFRLEYRREKALPENEIESFLAEYNQWEAGIHTEFFNRAVLFFTGEATYGGRNYKKDSDLLTSYNFWSVSFIANYSPWRNLSFHVMFDGLFEDHEVREDNAGLYLLSLGVTARIR